MKHLLSQLVAGHPLTRAQAAEAFELLLSGTATHGQIGAMLALMQQRGPTVEEVTGAAQAMRRHVAPVEVPAGLEAVDTCGTGGDHSGTFNISTAAALVAAAALRPRGMVVAKHGNRSVTSKSGSSQVLEALGVRIAVPSTTLTRCLDAAGICFCYAPAHHPAMKHVMPVRLELGFRTIFNILGPITNPAAARRQVMGVYSASLTQPIAEVFGNLGSRHAMVVHGSIPASSGGESDNAGIDEIATTGPSRISHLRDGQVTTYHVTPEELGLERAHLSRLKADSPEDSARVISRILAREAGAPRDIVCLNTAAALVVADAASSLGEGIAMAREAIDSGAAAATLAQLVRVSQAD